MWEIPNLNPMGGTRAADNTATGHATQKPVRLFEVPLLNHTAAGETIYDPFCGSGTAIIAAEKTGRRAGRRAGRRSAAVEQEWIGGHHPRSTCAQSGHTPSVRHSRQEVVDVEGNPLIGVVEPSADSVAGRRRRAGTLDLCLDVEIWP